MSATLSKAEAISSLLNDLDRHILTPEGVERETTEGWRVPASGRSSALEILLLAGRTLKLNGVSILRDGLFLDSVRRTILKQTGFDLFWKDWVLWTPATARDSSGSLIANCVWHHGSKEFVGEVLNVSSRVPLSGKTLLDYQRNIDKVAASLVPPHLPEPPPLAIQVIATTHPVSWTAYGS